jgi:hypothetical protein
MQFIGMGVVSGCVGYIRYFFHHVDLNSATNSDSIADCDTSGPGDLINIYTDIPGFFISALLVWMTLIYLRFS